MKTNDRFGMFARRENTNGVFYSILIVSCFTNKHKKNVSAN